MLKILDDLVPNADMQVFPTSGNGVNLRACSQGGPPHVHVELGVLAPYILVILTVARAHAWTMRLRSGMELQSALELTWTAIQPALGPTTDRLREAFFAASAPSNEPLH